MRRWLILLVLVIGVPALVDGAPARPLHSKPHEPGTPRVVLDTNHGSIVIELNADKAPITVKNFLRYVDAHHYDGTIVHRVIPKFMIQGGGYTAGMVEKKTADPIKNEATNGLSNVRGTIAVARALNPDSGTAQFFINLVDNVRLDQSKLPEQQAGYCVFGRVVAGMDVVDRIAAVPTGPQGGHVNLPTPDVVIRSVRRARN